ncbi:helix-turn-helix domain-containing protein [Lentzea indica]|uniref:helix-turn-helix domain-containing protein n=1 Tax=Lentzea indica TaxID=2604800 RepID=UPI0028B1454B|nr:helix-turn-helix domain-containing protein [Lentzea indica]
MARPRTITDERILAAVAAVIDRRGPEFTVADVAAEAGVSVGAVAKRFGSKSGLLQALTRAGTEEVAPPDARDRHRSRGAAHLVRPAG